MFQMKRQDKTPENQVKWKQAKYLITLIKMLKELRRRVDGQGEKLEVLHKEWKNKKDTKRSWRIQ